MTDNEISTNICVPDCDNSVYVVRLDGDNLFYSEDYDSAVEQAHLYLNTVLLDPDYDCIIEKDEDTITVIGRYRNFLVSYDRVMHNIQIERLNKANFIPLNKVD